ncbi:MAG: sulfatase-like hydrolase/transferase [Chloroflexi bacterium]|nr:sulfatase-like hydrolase/transferase [Chloroflexota bacterium]
MRILFIDIDTLRPDHLSCYRYHRNTSPNIDRVAAESVRFENYYASDSPCLPSRSALWSGRTGFHTGVINHGGTAADPFNEGPTRGFTDLYSKTGWISQIKKAGLYTATISSFAGRHSAWWWYAGYREMRDPGTGGVEGAEVVTPLALDWLHRHGREDNWFFHVNYWDPHTPYRAPRDFGNPFENTPLPAWLTEEVRQKSWNSHDPHSAQEPMGFGTEEEANLIAQYPRMPLQLDSMEAVRCWIDGYDTGIRYVDQHIGQLLRALEEESIFQDTIIMISADHGENQGELNVWGDHQTADQVTCRVPMIVHWPGLTEKNPRVDRALHYHFDWAATLIELLGGSVPENWDGQPFTRAFLSNSEQGREFLILSQGAWACQRSTLFEHLGQSYLCMRTYHAGYKMLDPLMTFNLSQDPHEQHDISPGSPEIVDKAMRYLADWQAEQMKISRTDVDPMMSVLRGGGPHHIRGFLPAYVERLKSTGRSDFAKILEEMYPGEIH